MNHTFLVGIIALLFGAIAIVCACPMAQAQPLSPMATSTMDNAVSDSGVPCHDSEQEQDHACPHCDQATALKVEVNALSIPGITTRTPDYAPYLQLRAPPLVFAHEKPILFAMLSPPRMNSSPITNKVRLLN